LLKRLANRSLTGHGRSNKILSVTTSVCWPVTNLPSAIRESFFSTVSSVCMCAVVRTVPSVRCRLMRSYRSITVVRVGVASVSHAPVVADRCPSGTGAWNQSASVTRAMSHRPPDGFLVRHATLSQSARQTPWNIQLFTSCFDNSFQSLTLLGSMKGIWPAKKSMPVFPKILFWNILRNRIKVATG